MARNRRNGTADRELGMDRAITRRDFVQGVAAGSVGLLATAWLPGCGQREPALPAAAQDRAGYYPPRLTGMRGSHPGSFENAHALRDGKALLKPIELDEQYDLVVVGAGMSGLAAAHFYRAAMPTARVLILDNHDDFGGHARRNEFDLGGRLHLMNGGTLEIDSPHPYAAVPAALLEELGVDVSGLSRRIENRKFYETRGLLRGVFFDRETF